MGPTSRLRTNENAAQIVHGFTGRTAAYLSPLPTKTPSEEVRISDGQALLYVNNLHCASFDGTVLEVCFPFQNRLHNDAKTAIMRINAIAAFTLGSDHLHVMPKLTTYGFTYTETCPHPYPLLIDTAQGILLSRINHEKIFRTLLRTRKPRYLAQDLESCSRHRITLPAHVARQLYFNTISHLAAKKHHPHVRHSHGSHSLYDVLDIVHCLDILAKLGQEINQGHMELIEQEVLHCAMEADYLLLLSMPSRIELARRAYRASEALSLGEALVSRLRNHAVMLKLTFQQAQVEHLPY